MFDANFSFGSLTTDLNSNTSAEVSPLTSRCSSPRLIEENHTRHSQPAPRRDSRYDTWRPPRHPSITALTNQFEHHVIGEQTGSTSPVSMLSPSESTLDDEGFYDGPTTPVTPFSDYASEIDPTLLDLSMFNYSATSSPRPSLSLEAQAMSSYTMRRKQRQALVRLQCLAQPAEIAMLIEECHPSSLPLSEAFSGNSKSRSNSTISLCGGGSCRVEKQGSSQSRKNPRMRKRQTH